MILEVEKIVKKFHKVLPKYSQISFDFRDFDEKDNLEQGFIDAKYGWSKYHIVMSVSNYDGIFIDCRVESHTDNYNCCEFEYDHSQDVDSTIKTAIDWIEKTLEEQKLIKN